MSNITIKLSLSGVVQHTPAPPPWRIKEKVDYIILKASSNLPHFIKTLKYLLSLHSSLWFYEAIKSYVNLFIFFFTIGGLNTDITILDLALWLASLSALYKTDTLYTSMGCLVGTGTSICACVTRSEHLWLWLSRWGRLSIYRRLGGLIPPPVHLFKCSRLPFVLWWRWSGPY